MNNYLSDDLSALLLEQYCEEKYNANFYLFISGFLRNKGLNGLAKHFEGQHDEEIGHSLLIYNFLIDLNTPFKVSEIDSIDFPITSIIDISEKMGLEKNLWILLPLSFVGMQLIFTWRCFGLQPMKIC